MLACVSCLDSLRSIYYFSLEQLVMTEISWTTSLPSTSNNLITKADLMCMPFKLNTFSPQVHSCIKLYVLNIFWYYAAVAHTILCVRNNTQLWVNMIWTTGPRNKSRNVPQQFVCDVCISLVFGAGVKRKINIHFKYIIWWGGRCRTFPISGKWESWEFVGS